MRNSTKIILGVLGAYLIADISDIAAKGQMLNGVRAVNKETSDKTRKAMLDANKNNAAKTLRVKLINKSADLFEELYKVKH